MKHKKLITALVTILTFFVAFGIFLIAWFFGDKYESFEKDFKEEFQIPGLADGAIPQGIGTYTAKYTVKEGDETVTKTQQYFLTSNYMNKKAPSRIYVTGADTGYVGYVEMKDTEGNLFYGHCGGVATNGSFLWVTGESSVYVAKASSAYAAKSKNILQEIIEKASRTPLEGTSSEAEAEYDYTISFTKKFAANCNSSFCYYFDDPRYSSVSYDRFYVGEFYRDGNYKTDETHHVKTPSGYQNNAFMYEYVVDSSSDYGLSTLNGDGIEGENKVPEIKKIYSLPEKVQGVAFSGRENNGTSTGTLLLSISYGLSNSHILCFDWKTVNSKSDSFSKLNETSFAYDGIYKVAGGNKIQYTASLNVYYVDKANDAMLTRDYSIPSMSEGMCSIGNRVYILFESAGKKYKTFVREKLENVYSLIPHK